MQERNVTETVEQDILEARGFRLVNQQTTESVTVTNTEAKTASEAQTEDASTEHEQWIETPEGERLESLEDVFHYLRHNDVE